MFADSFHERFAEAMAEAARRRAAPQADELVTRVERSPYGGFRVRSVPADFFVDQLVDGPASFSGGSGRRWAELAE